MTNLARTSWLVLATVTVAICGGAARGAEADFSTPKGTAKSLFHAINAGDRDAVRAAFYAPDDEQAQLAAAMADLIVAGKRLGDAAQKKFGKSGDAIGRGMLDPADLERLDAASVKETGDTAVLTLPEQQRPMSFRRQGKQWKLVVTDFGGAEPENVQKQTKLVSLMAEAVEESAEEIAANKYATADAAMTAIQQRLHAVMLSFHRPATTRAATQPGK